MSFIYLLLFFDIIIATVLLPYFPIIVLIPISFKYLYIQGLFIVYLEKGQKKAKNVVKKA